MTMPTKTEVARRVDLAFNKKFAPFQEPHRYKIAHGGRGSGKSWAVAIILILAAVQNPLRILCTRELQGSIRDSVHKLLSDQIHALGLSRYFTIQRDSITSSCGSEFIFKGLRHNASEIKSMEGINICWCEEAQSISKDSWELLEPTIRKSGSEIWITFNPNAATDATYQFVVNPPFDSYVVEVNFKDNRHFPKELQDLMERMRELDYDAYLNIWEGKPKRQNDAQIFKGKWTVAPFETPEMVDRFYYGVDWGDRDPMAVIRCYVHENKLYIDREAYSPGIDTIDQPAFVGRVVKDPNEIIRADCSLPALIRNCNMHGFPRMVPCKKGPDSIVTGILYIRGSFDQIVIHPDCKNIADEFSLYSYKVDRNNGDVLNEIVDKHNHGIDALRYSLEPLISSKHTVRTAKITGF